MTHPSAHRWNTTLDGRRLRQLRRQHRLSQVELAGKAGVSLSVITRLERQHAAPYRTRTLARLAAALAQPPTALTTAPDPVPGPAAS